MMTWFEAITQQHPHWHAQTTTTYTYTWQCRREQEDGSLCNRTHTSEFSETEPGDADYDGFNFHCECGAYYKKFWRVPDEWQLDSKVESETKQVQGYSMYCQECAKNPSVFIVPIIK
jgi:hypothetical protein